MLKAQHVLIYSIAFFITCVGIVFLRNYYTWPKTQPEEDTWPKYEPESQSGEDSWSKTQPRSFPKGVPRPKVEPKIQPESSPKEVPKTQPKIITEFPEKFVFGKPLEKVDLEYKRNIHFSVKTSSRNYRARLSLQLLTWFQAVDKDQV